MAGVVKNYNLSIDYVLYEMSVANIYLYNAVLPTYSSKKKDDDGEVFDAADPRNKEYIDQVLNNL